MTENFITDFRPAAEFVEYEAADGVDAFLKLIDSEFVRDFFEADLLSSISKPSKRGAT
ncbi:MAG: hypothetical protein AAF514_23250 [Verrucomicrobiota bacterium]